MTEALIALALAIHCSCEVPVAEIASPETFVSGVAVAYTRDAQTFVVINDEGFARICTVTW